MQDEKLVESLKELQKISKQRLYDIPNPVLPNGINQEIKELSEKVKLYEHDLSQPKNPTKSEYSIFY